MKRVLEIFGEPISHGGQESFVISFLSHMDLTDLQIDLLTPYYCDNSRYREIVEENGGNVIAFGLTFRPGTSRNNIVAPLKEYLRQNRYDVVHIHSGSISVLTLCAKTAKEAHVSKVITHSHCGIEKKTLKNTILRNLAAGTLRKNADIYCACSKEAAIAKYTDSVAAEETKLINNGVDLELFSFDEMARRRIRAELSLPESAYVIGHVGRFNYQKNHEYLIELFDRYQKTDPDAVLVLIGSGELEKAVREQVRAKALEEKVRFCGNVDNVNEYMQAMDTFLLPSRYEGLPIVGVEAQASGLPVITSDQVSRDLDISGHVVFLSLSDPEPWMKALSAYKKTGRFDSKEKIRENGYDLRQTAKIIRSMYLEDGTV